MNPSPQLRTHVPARQGCGRTAIDNRDRYQLQSLFGLRDPAVSLRSLARAIRSTWPR